MEIHRGCCVYFKHTIISIAQFKGQDRGAGVMGKKNLTEKKKAGK